MVLLWGQEVGLSKGDFVHMTNNSRWNSSLHSVFQNLITPPPSIVDLPHCSSPSINAGILFLQLGEETRRVHLTHELTSLDTLRALIVHMFPQRLTMAMLRYWTAWHCQIRVWRYVCSQVIELSAGSLIGPGILLSWSAWLHSGFYQSQGERWKCNFILRHKKIKTRCFVKRWRMKADKNQ